MTDKVKDNTICLECKNKISWIIKEINGVICMTHAYCENCNIAWRLNMNVPLISSINRQYEMYHNYENNTKEKIIQAVKQLKKDGEF